jgi:signal transduction histidine kinase
MTDREGSLETTLSGRARSVVVLVGLALAALTLIAAAGARRADGRPFPGLFVDPHGSFSDIWWPGWGGQKPPLRFPDRLVAVDGEALAGPASRFDLATHRIAARVAAAVARGGDEVRLTFATARGPLDVRRPLRRLGAEEAAFFFGLYALMGVFVLWSGFAVLALARRRAGAIAYAAWSVGTFVFMVTFYDYHSTAVLAPLFSLSTVSVQLCALWLAYSFPEPPRRLRRALRATMVAVTALDVAAAAALVAGPPLGIDVVAVRVVIAFAAPLSILVLPASVFLKLRGEEGQKRQELLSSALGLAAVPAVVGVGFLVSIVTGASLVHLLLPFLAPLVPLSIGYALIRHNILGTTALLSRRMFAAPVLAGAFAVALVAWLALHAALRSRDGSAVVPWVGGAVALAVVAGIGFRVSGRIFFAATAKFRPTLQQLADDLASKGNFAEIRSAIQAAVMRWLPTENADVVPPGELHRIANRPEKLRTRMGEGVAVWTTEADWRRHLLVPMRSQGGLRGVLVLAPKHEGALYTREDLELLETIASLGAVALHNAEVFEELETMRRLEAEAARDDKRLALGLLGAEISHEIAYPLNFLRYLLREGEGGRPFETRDLEVGREEIGRLERMFATLRKLKIPTPEVEPVLVLPRVRRALDLIRELCEQKRITIALDVPPDLTVTAEADSLVQILANLLRNAAQAVGAGSSIGVRSRAEAGGGMVLEVWDDGPGVAGELEGAIFNPFVSSKQGSMGLGLAVTHRLVRTFGWNIGVRRDAGRTVFGIEIPPPEPVRPYGEARP